MRVADLGAHKPRPTTPSGREANGLQNSLAAGSPGRSSLGSATKADDGKGGVGELKGAQSAPSFLGSAVANTAAALAFGLALAASANAENTQSTDQGNPVTASLNAFLVDTAPSGKERLILAREARPGDVVEYQAEYRNRGMVPVRNLAVEVPIPQGMEYVPGSARPADVLASLDGQTFGPVPLMRTANAPGGSAQPEPAAVANYRFLRWRITEIGPGSAVPLVLRVKLVGEIMKAPPNSGK